MVVRRFKSYSDRRRSPFLPFSKVRYSAATIVRGVPMGLILCPLEQKLPITLWYAGLNLIPIRRGRLFYLGVVEVDFMAIFSVPLNSPRPAQRHNIPPSPLSFFMGDIISIIPESFKNLKILTPKNALAPVWDQPWPSGSRKWRKLDRRKFNFSKLSGMLGTTSLNGNIIILGSLWVFRGS